LKKQFDAFCDLCVTRKTTNKVTLAVTDSRTWMCLICGWIYDEATGDAEHGLAPGTKWDAVPMNWTCPECGARKEDFEMVQL
jgi:rubredoxin